MTYFLPERRGGKHSLVAQTLSRRLTGKELLTEKEVVSSAIMLPVNESGIYFLIIADRVAYVGQSKSLNARITEQCRRGISKVAWMLLPKEDLDKYESLYIHAFKPAWNGGSKKGMRAPISLQELSK